MKTIEGLLTVTNEKFCIIVSRFNEFICSKLLSGALDELKRHGVNEENIDVVWCPGAFEIPLVAKKCAKSGKYNSIITLGAVIKGSTSHYDYVCAEVSKGVASVSLETGIPVIFGVLTTIVSLSVYYFCVLTFLNPNNAFQLQIANILSWILAVAFAYVTNRKFVFESKDPNKLKELIKFVTARLLTLFLDMLVMFILVTLLHFNDKISKLISQVIITISNYIFSKIFVFKK